MPANRSLEVVDGGGCCACGCDGPAFGGPLSNRSMMLDMLFCDAEACEVDCGGGDEIDEPPPRMSARRSALCWLPFITALTSVAGVLLSPIKSRSMSCSVT